MIKRLQVRRTEKFVPANRKTVEVSVVLAAPDGGPSLDQCIKTLEAQISQFSGEILVVHGREHASVDRSNSNAANLRWIPPPAGTEVPDLWKAGIDASTGETIVLLVESCIPGPDWLKQVLRLRRSQTTVVGGAIDLAPDLGIVDSAVYFCRYSPYMPPLTAQYVDDLPGTNCCYPRAALATLEDEMAEGFWETFIHKKMANRGVRLLCDPAILVRYIGPASGGSFARVRFVHGREFAARRATSFSGAKRILRFLAFPLVTVLMLQRIAVRVWTKRRYWTRFLISSPLLIFFLAAWCAGESLGYLLGSSRTAQSGANQRKHVLPEAS